MLLPSTKVAAKKLLILSKTKHDAKSAQEGDKPAKMDSLQRAQNLITVHIYWTKEELVM